MNGLRCLRFHSHGGVAEFRCFAASAKPQAARKQWQPRDRFMKTEIRQRSLQVRHVAPGSRRGQTSVRLRQLGGGAGDGDRRPRRRGADRRRSGRGRTQAPAAAAAAVPTAIPTATAAPAAASWPRIEGDLSAIERLNDGYRRITKELLKAIVGQTDVHRATADRRLRARAIACWSACPAWRRR